MTIHQKEKAARKRLCSFILFCTAQPNRLPSLIDFSEWHEEQSDCKFEKSNGSPPRLIGTIWSTIRAASSRPLTLHALHSGSLARCDILTFFHLVLL